MCRHGQQNIDRLYKVVHKYFVVYLSNIIYQGVRRLTTRNWKLIFRSNYEDEYIFHCSKIELQSFTAESMHGKTDLDAYWLLQGWCRQCSYSRNCRIMQHNAGAPRRWLCRKLAAAPWAGTGSADLQHSAGEHCHGNCVSLVHWYFVRTLRTAG